MRDEGPVIPAEIDSKPKGKPRPLPAYIVAPAAFHAGYAAFVADWINEGSRAVEIVDVDGSRCVVIAGVHRIYARKSDGHLVYEEKVFSRKKWRGKWAPCAHSFSLFGNLCHWHEVVFNAFHHRLLPFVGSTEKQFDNSWGSLNSFSSVTEATVRVRTGSGHKNEAVGRKAKIWIAILAQTIWSEIVDKKITSLAYAYFGLRFTMHEYNLVVSHAAALRDIAVESPNVLPLVGAYVRDLKKKGLLGEQIPKDLVARTKALLREAGLSEAGWRYLLRASIATVRIFTRQLWVIEDFGRQPDPEIDVPPAGWHIKESPACLKINLLAATQNRSPHAFDAWLIRDARRLEPHLKDPSASRFVRLASLEASSALKQKRLNLFIKNDLPLCQDWLIGDVKLGEGGYGHHGVYAVRPGNIPLTVVPKNATWTSIMRAQREWHLDAEARRIAYEVAMEKASEADRKAAEARLAAFKDLKWESLVDAVDLDGIVATPLSTGACLLQEAEEMAHCVDSYAPDCLKGFSRLFSLAGSGERATLELAPKGKHWVVVQLYGYDNTEASKAMWVAGAKVAKLYTFAQRSVKRAA